MTDETLKPDSVVGGAESNQSFIPLSSVTDERKILPVEGEDFKQRVKSFDPVAGSLWNVPLGISSKIVRNRSFRIYNLDPSMGEEERERKADEAGEMVKPSPESLQAAKQATARILARRCKDGESADVAIILSVGAEMVHGTYVVLKDIKETENRILAALARKGSK